MQCVDTNEDCESMLSTNILQLFYSTITLDMKVFFPRISTKG